MLTTCTPMSNSEGACAGGGSRALAALVSAALIAGCVQSGEDDPLVLDSAEETGGIDLGAVEGVGTLSLSPAEVFNDSAVSCVFNADGGTSFSPEGFSWSINGAEVATGASLTLDGSLARPGDEVGCVAVVVDDAGRRETIEVSAAVVNRVPSLETPVVSPDGPFNDAVLTCVASAYDADGEDLSSAYRWTLDATGEVLGNEPSLSLSAEIVSPGDDVRCTVTITDASGGKVEDWAEITVANRVPVASAVVITPSAPFNDTILTCEVTASDADGTSLSATYSWRLAGMGNALGGGASLDLAPLGLAPGDVVECEAAVSDGIASDATTAQAVIGNRGPVLQAPVVSPDPVFNDSELSCDAVASDPDGEAVSLEYTWENQTRGTMLAGVGTHTLQAGEAAPGDTLTCSVSASDGALEAEASVAVVVSSRAPVVSEVTITPDAAFNTDTLTCAATATDADGGTPTLGFAWRNVTAGIDLGEGASVTLSSSTAAPGDEIRCEATATDVGGMSDSGSVSRMVGNRAPEVSGVTITPAAAYNTSTLSCAAIAADADGEVPTLSFAWRNHTQSKSLGEGASITLSSEDASPGDEIRCIATAADAGGLTGKDSSSIAVGNRAPEVGEVTVGPATAYNTSTLTCSATVADEDGETPTLDFVWRNVTRNMVVSTEAVSRLTPNDASPGEEIACTATATDAGGRLGAESASLTLGNRAPAVVNVTISPGDPTLTQTVNCAATATDPDGQTPTMSYAWTRKGTGTLLGAGESLVLDDDALDAGDIVVCTATAQDGALSGMKVAEVMVQSRPPVVGDVAITPATAHNTSTLTCTAPVTDPEGGTPTLSYEWRNLTRDTVLGGGASRTLTPGVSSPGDVIGCTLTATNAVGAAVSSSGSVLLVNRAPTASNASISPSTAYNTSTLVCSAAASDSDGGTPTLVFDWRNLTRDVALGSGASITLTSQQASPGDDIRCNVTATDAVGETASTQADVTLGNRSPTVGAVTVTPSTAYVTSELACSASVTDADGETPSLSYQWFNVSRSTNLGVEPVVQLNTSVVSAGDQVRCTVTAVDGAGAQGSGSRTLSLSNQPPAISTPVITPVTAYNTNTLTCSATATDPDTGTGVNVSYSWRNVTKNTDLGPGAAKGLTTSLATPLDEIRCLVTATDSGGLTSTAQQSITLDNRAPTMGTPSIFPSALYNSSYMSCSVSRSDPDGDSTALRSYVLRNESRDVVLDNDSGVSLSPSLASPGDTLSCTATVSDGIAAPLVDTVSAVVVDRAPIVGEVTITPRPVWEDTTVSCAATASDPDGAAVSVTYAWTNETAGTSIGSQATLSLSPAVVALGDVVRCTVTADDGALSGSNYVEKVVGDRTGEVIPTGYLGNVVYVGSGTFEMGCKSGRDSNCDWTESPLHVVTLTNDFLVMETEVTQRQYASLMSGRNPSRHSSCGLECPVEQVSWFDAVSFANKASDADGLERCYSMSGCGTNSSSGTLTCTSVSVVGGDPYSCEGWRLPTEAEWEYAARGGEEYQYAGSDSVGAVAWYSSNSSNTTHLVCGKERNALGLCDMSGNVMEWNWDWYRSDYYSMSPAVDPFGPTEGKYPSGVYSDLRSARGGSWSGNASYARLSNRFYQVAYLRSGIYHRWDYIGFRLVRTVSTTP